MSARLYKTFDSLFLANFNHSLTLTFSDPTPEGSNVLLPDTVAPDTPFMWDEFEDSTTDPDKLGYMYADNGQIYVGHGYRQREYAFTTEYGTYLGNLADKHNVGGAQRLSTSPYTRVVYSSSTSPYTRVVYSSSTSPYTRVVYSSSIIH